MDTHIIMCTSSIPLAPPRSCYTTTTRELLTFNLLMWLLVYDRTLTVISAQKNPCVWPAMGVAVVAIIKKAQFPIRVAPIGSNLYTTWG
jgi:hypothetical protein